MNRYLILMAVLGLTVPALAPAAEAQKHSGTHKQGTGHQAQPKQSTTTTSTMSSPGSRMTSAEKIDNAMSAAPASIAAGATIMDFPAKPGGAPTQLRAGQNGWTCFPDMPNTPGNDPMCVDKTWMLWLDAYLNKTTPKITETGLAYMLQGGSEASNDDPFATQPAAGDSWHNSPPHIMVITPGRLDTSVFSSTMGGSKPWIMFGGTPYEHLMIPVK